jgi:hypothetical protein
LITPLCVPHTTFLPFLTTTADSSSSSASSSDLARTLLLPRSCTDMVPSPLVATRQLSRACSAKPEMKSVCLLYL